ncbi:hypothetical protein [Shewanella waksmanii]|uniref:hypothetical protein n=1 Tax=Shewanella waksmanii TaxID=213783 RepID=UPI003735CA97
MIAKSIYEVLPYSYLTLGGSSMLVLENTFAVIAALVIFMMGARVYNLRSKNRRTDPVRKRKSRGLPESLYDLLPFIYLCTAFLLFRFYPQGAGPILGICLLTYSFYILLRRISYRQHKIPAENNIM